MVRIVLRSGARGRIICVLALFCRALLFRADALFAQTVSIFIPEVSGTGAEPDESAFFTQMLMIEVAARNYPPAESRETSLYSMHGSLSPVVTEDDSGESGSRYALHLSLVDNATDEVLVEQDLVYTYLDEANEILPLLVFTMLANIPPQPAPPAPELAAFSEAWRQKWWYFDAFACWSPRVYTGAYQSANIVNFGFGFATEIHFLNFMSFETGVELAQDWVVISVDEDVDYRGHVLEIPALLKVVLKPGMHYMIEPYAGAQINLPLNDVTAPPLLALAAGLQYGVKAGPGAFFVDARFSLDLGDSSLEREPANKRYTYHRYAIKLAAGYKIGVFSRNKKER